MSKMSVSCARRKILARLTTLAGMFAASLAMPVQAADPVTITVLGYRAGGFQENYIKAVVEPFMKANPEINVKYHGLQNAASMLGMMRAQKSAPQTDAAIFDLSVAKIAKAEGLITPIDPKLVPNYADLKEVGRELGLWAPPVTYDTLALIYNKAAFPVAPTSWKVLWDKKHHQKIIIPGIDVQAIAFTLVANHMAGQPDYRKSIRPGVDSLVKLAPAVMTWEPKPDQYTLVANGGAEVAVGWNARGQLNADAIGSGKIAVVSPTEGTAFQVNIIAQVSGGKNAAATQAFINYALSPVAQKSFSELMYYAPTNSKVKVSETALKRIPLLDKNVQASLLPINWLEVSDMRDSILEPWRREIIPASR